MRAEAEGRDLAEEIRMACARYVERMALGSYAMTPPYFRDGTGEAQDIALHLDEQQWQSLEDEAERQGVTLEHLVEHAAFLALAHGENSSE